MKTYSDEYLEHYADRYVAMHLRGHGITLEQYLADPARYEHLALEPFPLLPEQREVQERLDAEAARVEAEVAHLPRRNGRGAAPPPPPQAQPAGVLRAEGQVMGVQLDKTMGELESLLRTKLRGEILDHLVANRHPQGSRTIADALGKPHHAVQRAVCELVLQGRITQVARGADRKPVYRPVEVGPCEWCGLVSHHLVAGECPSCKTLTLDLARPSLARLVC